MRYVNELRDSRRVAASFLSLMIAVLMTASFASAASGLDVVIGDTWDPTTLQEVLDAEYGAGTIDVMNDYEGALPGDADPAYWEDLGVNSILIREIAGYSTANSLGWYQEDLSGPPVIDGFGDGLIFPGPVSDGAEVYFEFPSGTTTFGFYLNPQGGGSSCNAPEPERFFTNRFYNDIGPDGSGATHAPFDGDVQCLIFNISHLRGGVPTFVLAWEDFDSGAELSPTYDECKTDNDFNDMVVEITAFSPVPTESGSFGTIKSRYTN